MGHAGPCQSCHETVRKRWKYKSLCLESVKKSGKELMGEKSRCPGLTGLTNLGNTCYMNAVLQCLCSVPRLVEYFLSEEYKAAPHKKNGKSVAAFGCLVSRMWLGDFNCVSPEDFLTALGTQSIDEKEFSLLCTYETPSKSSKRCITDAKAGRGSVSETSIITELFEGQLSYDITCLQCKATTNRAESFTVLSLPIPSKSMCSLQ
ncbi:PREDICTED: putative ubiquitin carboxyl-terminal hydrolase 50, partial [Chlamydotis macqueenii]|uniref:putative ubiquitin carboxyl-terminal hydrolase 50 n=1 Tax=Chlamydotis macqueenii TaxID=187382 RepID=UPI000529E112